MVIILSSEGINEDITFLGGLADSKARAYDLLLDNFIFDSINSGLGSVLNIKLAEYA